MKVADIVNQMAALLPLYTDKFTKDVAVTSLTRAGTTITAVAPNHGLSDGQGVVITGSDVPIAISSLTRLGTIGTLVTSTPHDLTNPVAPTVTIEGATEVEFNGTFNRLNVNNRNTITFEMADAGALTATGSPILRFGESALRSYNGIYKVSSIVDKNTFTFEHSVAGLADPIGTIIARIRPRVTGAISPERAMQAYTSQEVDTYWAVVILEDVVASKGRNIASDAIDNIQRGNTFRQQILQPFTIYVFIPVNNEIAARDARDEAETLFRDITRAVLHSKFDSQLAVGKQNTAQFVSHGLYNYDTALYVHAYSFQQVVDLTFDDTVGHDLDVAFRDIDLTIFPDLGGTGFMQTLGISLDDE